MLLQIVKKRLDAVEERIAAACQRAGRQRSEVTMVAVTKTVPIEVAACLPELGVFDLAENRPQELWRKAPDLPKTVRWHMIGHLQRNKIERTLPLVHMIHSVDSLRLLEALDAEGRDVPLLLEVNTGGEDSKGGFSALEILAVGAKLRGLRHVRVRGLMTMAPLQEAEACRREFRLLHNIRENLRATVEPPHTLEHLSMGMSNDFDVAIEEGATMVRLGTVLFEGIMS